MLHNDPGTSTKMPPTLASAADLIKQIKAEHGLNQSEIAHAVGLNPGRITRALQGGNLRDQELAANGASKPPTSPTEPPPRPIESDTSTEGEADAAGDSARMIEQGPPPGWSPDDDIDSLSRTCPKCGALAEWPDCESCGYLFDESEPEAVAPHPSVDTHPPRTPYELYVVDAHEIPRELRERPVWVAWEIKREQGKKPGKVPVSPVTGRKDGWSNNPKFAGTFEQAHAFAHQKNLNGLGVLLWPGCGLGAVDLDHCRDMQTGELSEMARDIMAQADSYTEVSPGLSGIRIIFSGSFGGFDGTDNPRGIEFYEQKRFVTITGDHIEDSPFAIEARDLTDLGRRYFPTKERSQPPKTDAPSDFSSVDLDAIGLARHTMHVIRTGDAESYGGDRSKALFAVTKDLVKFGFDDHTIARILCDPANGISQKSLEERGGDIASAMDWTVKYTVAAARRAKAAAGGSTSAQGPANSPQEPPQSKLRRVDLSRIASAELAPPKFIIFPFIPREHLTLFGGHGGSGKSVCGLVMGAHVAVGRPWADLTVTRGRVLYISMEDGAELVLWRLKRIAEAYDMDPAMIAERLTVIDGSDAEPLVFEFSDAGVKSIGRSYEGTAVEELIEAEKPDLVIVDNASDAFDGDENQRRQVRWFVRWLSRAVRPHNGAVLLLAHIDKAAARFGGRGNSYSGTTAWHNSARSRLALIDDEIHHEKLNVGKKREEPIRISWGEHGVPMPDMDGTGREAADAITQGADDDAVLECFRAADEAGQTVPAAATGPATAWHALSVYPECPKHLKTDKARLRESVARLLRSGRIHQEEYTTASRNKRVRLSLADSLRASVRVSSNQRRTDENQRPYACVSSHRGMGGLTHADRTDELTQVCDAEVF
ncbi:AAA family ATPase [Thiocystis violacea]|uniref:AAA family ATPase n=1 Tax=Thiocystis violacea TaxID=13725 RepID=UPI001906CEFC|nr:AAA family ATPase [Thiocystis violacea]MBK1724697.1 hypothetical protein [Thiocystis violacea]